MKPREPSAARATLAASVCLLALPGLPEVRPGDDLAALIAAACGRWRRSCPPLRPTNSPPRRAKTRAWGIQPIWVRVPRAGRWSWSVAPPASRAKAAWPHFCATVSGTSSVEYCVPDSLPHEQGSRPLSRQYYSRRESLGLPPAPCERPRWGRQARYGTPHRSGGADEDPDCGRPRGCDRGREP